MAVARELMLTYLLFCNHIFADSNFDTPNSYGHIFTIVLRHLAILLSKSLSSVVKNKL